MCFFRRCICCIKVTLILFLLSIFIVCSTVLCKAALTQYKLEKSATWVNLTFSWIHFVIPRNFQNCDSELEKKMKIKTTQCFWFRVPLSLWGKRTVALLEEPNLFKEIWNDPIKMKHFSDDGIVNHKIHYLLWEMPLFTMPLMCRAVLYSR